MLERLGTVTSSGGAVTVDATGGGTGASANNFGLFFDGTLAFPELSSGGSGALTVIADSMGAGNLTVIRAGATGNATATFKPRTADTTSNLGAVVTNGTGLTYTPVTNFIGADSYSFTVADGFGGVATAQVLITVQPAAGASANLTPPASPRKACW